MLETYLRPLYQKILIEPFASWWSNYFSPNSMTLIGCLLGMTVAIALLVGMPIVACILLLFSGYCDTLDGTLARLTNNISAVGSMLDIVSDRAVEFAVIVGLYSCDPLHRGWLTLLMLGSVLICVTSFLVVGIFTPNETDKGFYYSPGLIERAEAFVFFIAMMLFPSYFQSLALLFSILVLLTAARRMQQFVQQQNSLTAWQTALVAKNHVSADNAVVNDL